MPYLGQRDQVVRDAFDGLAGLVVQVEVIELLDDVASMSALLPTTCSSCSTQLGMVEATEREWR